MNMSSSKDSIPIRLAKLNQQIEGKVPASSLNHLILKDGLLDSLLALYDECKRKANLTQKNPPRHFSGFLHRVGSTVKDIQRLRVNANDFSTLKLIGQGHFGQVKVVKEKVTGEIYALKVIRKKDVLAHQEAAYFEEERDIMAKSNNAWLTQLHYAFQDEYCLYLAMDFHPGGDLAILLGRHETLSEDTAKFYVAEMVLAVHAVHSLGYIHRDIKPDNFLIDRTGHLKLTDFGSAAKMNSDGKVSGKMPVGTPDYIAPELLTSMTSSSDRPYNRLVDWWSLGIITYEMVCGHLPFSDENHSVVNTYSKIMKFKENLIFAKSDVPLTHTAKKFIEGLLTEARFRMGFDQISSHKFLNTMNLKDIRSATPPYIPKVAGPEDTSNFEEVDARQNSPGEDFQHSPMRDLPFIGFTFYRNLALLKAKSSTSSTPGTDLLDKVLQGAGDHDGCNRRELQQSQKKESALRKEIEKLRAALKQKDGYIDKLESSKETQTRELAYLNASNVDLADQNKKLTSTLEATREVYEKVMGETEDFMQVLHGREKDQTEYEHTMSQELEYLKSELVKLDGTVVEKDAELVALGKKAERLDGENNRLKSLVEIERQRADKANQLLSESRKGTLIVKCEIETQHVQSEGRVTDLQMQLDKVLSSNRAATELIEQMKDEKFRLEQELSAVKAIATRRQTDRDAEMKRHTISETEKMRLSRAEVRNAELSSEIHAKSQQAQLLALKISDLTDQVEDAQQHYEREKKSRQEVERSLRDRIQELEDELAKVYAQLERLKQEQRNMSDNAPENKCLVIEQSQTIEILKANVEKLENLICGMREGFDEKEQRRDQRGRQETRRWAEIVGELKQENMYLERKIEHLNTQLQAKVDFESSYKDRLKAARLELQEVKEKADGDIAVLKKEALEAEVKMTDAKSEAASNAQSERLLRRRFENLQKQVQEKESTHEQQLQDVQNEKQTLSDQIEILKEESQIIDELEAEVTRLAHKCASSDAENKSLKLQTNKAVEAKTQACLKMEKLEVEKRNAERQADSANEEVRKLKLLCNDMENNTQDLESLLSEYEKNQEIGIKENKELDATICRLLNKTERLEACLQAERNQRQTIDERNERSKVSMQSQLASHRSKEENLQKEVAQQKVNIERLRKQVRTLECEAEKLEMSKRSASLNLAQAEDENKKLKEEAATWKTQISNLKAANSKLSFDLELLLDKLDEVTEMKNTVENSMENLVLTKEHDQYRSEQTLSQQSKLIDFLQQRYEAPLKKKSGSKLFQSKRKDDQHDEFAQALESERSRSRKLQDEVKELKTELYQTKVSSIKGSRDLSQLSQTSEVSGDGAVGQDSGVVCGAASNSVTPAKPPAKSSQKTMKHNIPHRLSVSLNCRATKCGVCQNSVMFGRQAAKCQDCHIVTHEKCRTNLPATCGLPTQFMQVYSQAMTQKSLSSAGGVLEADLKLIELGGWMKVKGLEDSAAWMKRFVLLENRSLLFYLSDDTTCQPLEYFDLRKVHLNLISDVNPAELMTTVSPDDMPYIIKLEFSSPAIHRVIYLLAANFTEKEKWDSTLEAIISHGSMATVHQDTKLQGNRLVQLAGSSLVDVNCCLLIGESDILLLGAAEGLLACQLSYTSEPLIKVEGIGSVYQMSNLEIPDRLMFIAGQKRWLCLTSYSTLRAKMCSSQNTISGAVTIVADKIGDIHNCSMFRCSELNGRCAVVAATPTYISVIYYSNTKREFTIIQEVRISEPCSCICYTPDFVLFGTDTVHKLSVQNGSTKPFLNPDVKHVTSYNSFPIELLCVSNTDSSKREYLCCFTDVGVFVDSQGNRTRDEDIQWSGLPLAFAYRSPYLYVVYYKAMQVIGPLEQTGCNWKTMQAFLNIQSPRYLGPAYTDGAVYVASIQDGYTDVVVFKGNLSLPGGYSEYQSADELLSDTDGSDSNYHSLERKTQNSRQHNKENRPKNKMPSMIHKYHEAVLRTGIGIKPSRQLQASSETSVDSSSQELAKPRTPLNSDYFSNIYGSGKQKDASASEPHHTDV